MSVSVNPGTRPDKLEVATKRISGEEYPLFIKANPDGSLLNEDKTAFGESAVAESTPVVQIQFPYNINSEIVTTHNNGGTVTVDSDRAKLSTGAGANQSAEMFSVIPVKYNPGQGGLCRFTAVFSTGVEGSSQVIGIGSKSDGYFFGYNGADFGILRRYGGAPEIRVLTITTGSSTAEDITIRLDGDAKADVTVTASGNTDTTANEIGSADYSGIGRGWEAHSAGDGNVIFISYDAAAHSGSYSLSGASTAVGAFAQDIAGSAPTDTWVAQTAWNVDRMRYSADPDNSPSQVTIDATKGNVYQVKYQWLGYGLITFYIENPINGSLVLVHRIQYANANTVPSVSNPTLPLCAVVGNTTNTSDIVMYTPCMAGFTEGKTNDVAGVSRGVSANYSAIDTTETPILTIHNPNTYQGVENRVRVKLTFISISVEGTKPSTFRVRRESTLVGASYTAINADSSVIEYDTAATSVTGGTVEIPTGMAKSDSKDYNLVMADFFLEPGSFLTITGQASIGTIEGIVSIDWKEQF